MFPEYYGNLVENKRHQSDKMKQILTTPPLVSYNTQEYKIYVRT